MSAEVLGNQALPQAGKYLTFGLDTERYGVAVLKVREIIRLCPITAVPGVPPHILGVINLRGQIVPVLDLRLRFGMAPAPSQERVCIIVVRYQKPGEGEHQMGVIVDRVYDVARFASADMRATPDFGNTLDSRFITGMAESRGVVNTLLDIDRLLGTDAWTNVLEPAT